MKKILTVLLVLVICFASVFAYQNTYNLESKEVQSFLLLRRLTNTNTADPTYPISASQLADLVKSLDTSKLNDTSRAMYDNLLKEIEQPEVFFGKDGMGVDVDISLLGAQVMKSAEPNTYGILPFKDRMATAEIKATMYMKDYMTGVFDLASRTKLDYYKGDEKKPYINTLLNFMKYSEGVPDYAYASIGFDDLNFVIGRDRLAAGNGKTGNLELGGNILFDNFAKLSFVGSFISYDFTLDSFEHGNDTHHDTSILAPKKNIYLHRVSFNFKDFLSFSAYEGALVYAVNPFNDIQFFNPFMFMHNTGSYYEADTNNFAGFEFSAVIPGHFQVDAQLLLDQLGGSDGNGENAFAALLNVSNTQTIGKGILDAYAEFVYGNPYVYLKNDHGFGMYEGFDRYANLDLVNDAKSDFNNGDNGRELQYLGYRYGGDLFSIGAGAAYLLDDAKFTLDLQFINKGSNGIWGANENRKASEPTGNNMKVIKAYAGYEQTFIDAVKVEARLGGAEYINYQHSGKNLFDPQFSIGVSIQPLEFIKNKGTL